MASLGVVQIGSPIPVDQAERVSLCEGHPASTLTDRSGRGPSSRFQNRHGIDQVRRECETAVHRQNVDHGSAFYQSNSGTLGTHEELITAVDEPLSRCAPDASLGAKSASSPMDRSQGLQEVRAPRDSVRLGKQLAATIAHHEVFGYE